MRIGLLMMLILILLFVGILSYKVRSLFRKNVSGARHRHPENIRRKHREAPFLIRMAN